jgi:hypothetical protein
MQCGQADLGLTRPQLASRWRKNRVKGCLMKIFFAFLMSNLIFALIETFFPSRAMLYANMNAVAARGSDICQAIIARECLGDLTWAQAFFSGATQTNDILGVTCKTSTEYFEAMFKIENNVTTNRITLQDNFDYSKLAGAGVPPCHSGQTLTAANNMWSIAANVTSEDDPRIPVLLTRNVDVNEIERVVNQGLKKNEFKKRITFSGIYKSPFSIKGFVAVFKDGHTVRVTTSRKATLGELFDNKELPPRDPSKPPIVYLMP